MSTKQSRCAWANSSPLMSAYHDEEWGVPQYDSRTLWEMLMLEGFQAGLSWSVVLNKRETFQKAFKNFDPEKVAKLKEKDIENLMQNPGIIRARAKIEATIGGAKVYLRMQEEGEDFSDFVWNLAGGKPIKNSGPVPTQTELSVLERVQKTRIQIRGTCHRLRLDAGSRYSRRPRTKLSQAQRCDAC
jgi:DNA-3-methyladenine glycosylase I